MGNSKNRSKNDEMNTVKCMVEDHSDTS